MILPNFSKECKTPIEPFAAFDENQFSLEILDRKSRIVAEIQ